MAGFGRASTRPANGWLSLFPGVRIDQAYLAGSARAVRSAVLETADSDHRPIVVDVEW